MKKNNTDFFEKNYFLSFNTKRFATAGKTIEASRICDVPKMAEIKEILIACQDALRYEDNWDAKDFQMLITKAIKLCEEK